MRHTSTLCATLLPAQSGGSDQTSQMHGARERQHEHKSSRLGGPTKRGNCLLWVPKPKPIDSLQVTSRQTLMAAAGRLRTVFGFCHELKARLIRMKSASNAGSTRSSSLRHNSSSDASSEVATLLECFQTSKVHRQMEGQLMFTKTSQPFMPQPHQQRGPSRRSPSR